MYSYVLFCIYTGRSSILRTFGNFWFGYILSSCVNLKSMIFTAGKTSIYVRLTETYTDESISLK